MDFESLNVWTKLDNSKRIVEFNPSKKEFDFDFGKVTLYCKNSVVRKNSTNICDAISYFLTYFDKDMTLLNNYKKVMDDISKNNYTNNELIDVIINGIFTQDIIIKVTKTIMYNFPCRDITIDNITLKLNELRIIILSSKIIIPFLSNYGLEKSLAMYEALFIKYKFASLYFGLNAITHIKAAADFELNKALFNENDLNNKLKMFNSISQILFKYLYKIDLNLDLKANVEKIIEQQLTFAKLFKFDEE